MQDELVEKWRELLPKLADVDAIGVNWHDATPHFSGNFWLTKGTYIRTLKPFVAWHHAHRLERLSCEFWIGSGKRPRVISLAHRNADFCSQQYFG